MANWKISPFASVLIFLYLPCWNQSNSTNLKQSDSSISSFATLLLLAPLQSDLGGLPPLPVLFPALVTRIAADKGDWSTEWSSWTRKKVVTRRPSVIVKERLKGESVVFDIKKAEVGVRYRVVEDDYGIRQLIPIDVPVYKEEDYDAVDVSGIDPGLKVRTRYKKRIRPSPKFKTCHRPWHGGRKGFGEVECVQPSKRPKRRKVTRRPNTTQATTTADGVDS